MHGRGAEPLTIDGHFAAHSPDPPECFEQDAWGEADKMKEMRLLASLGRECLARILLKFSC